MKSINYSIRNVAFIDILGFSDLINKSGKHNTILKSIYESLTIMRDMKNIIPENGVDELSPQVSVFSDNIVISYINDNRESEFLLIRDCIFLYLSLLTKGILLRGGITTGELYHDENVVFGPALVKAYKIESKFSIYPRIVVDDTNYYSELNGSLYKRDFDGLVYIDPINNLDCVGKAFNESPFEILSSIHDQIVNKELTNDLGIDSKLLWLKNYSNSCFKKEGNKIITLNKPQYLITPLGVKPYESKDFT
ncbi:hypothetical protein BK120_32460 [Paenibacillus sp. FSL A5-0031]|uniref:hypothetical protein n=1 Tax=Paenibacillus sp. FSL A5-0031 TaxID=1920420 RepID=UPI00096D17E6|nr:hypothetical protein [Paenibacillus sp. FSL A5-0031]OME73992.1 hypothetical protein BK120_32460 [Paenibacillus sp. FSL A5-0031]